MKINANIKKANKIRSNIERILDRYSITMTEVAGVYRPGKDEDEKNWGLVKKDYKKIQKKIFTKQSPSLLEKIKTAMKKKGITEKDILKDFKNFFHSTTK